MNHRLKTWPIHFAAMADGSKTFEVRKNDRDFKVGDHLILDEWDPVTGKYTKSESLRFNVWAIVHEHEGLRPGFCVMSVRRATR